jgi:hypothetical protein
MCYQLNGVAGKVQEVVSGGIRLIADKGVALEQITSSSRDDVVVRRDISNVEEADAGTRRRGRECDSNACCLVQPVLLASHSREVASLDDDIKEIVMAVGSLQVGADNTWKLSYFSH